MGDVEHGDVPLVAQAPHQVEHADAHGDVQHRRRFVGQDEARFHRQRASDGDALTLAAGEFVRVGLEHVLGQADRFYQLAQRLWCGGVAVQDKGPGEEVLDAVDGVE